MAALFLGAGFSAVVGVPLARQLFDEEPELDRITRRQLVERVANAWQTWRARTGGQPEEYLSELERGGGKTWEDARWYVALIIALRTGGLRYVGDKPTIVKHNLDRTTANETHEQFWTEIFRYEQNLTVITTNYDILAERGMRNSPRIRIPRRGFHYGTGPEELHGGGYPTYAHIQKITVIGEVPLLKLHGSVSWSYRHRDRQLIKYHDCRPAIRGDAAIVAPVTEKLVPDYLEPLWVKAGEALSKSRKWLIVGYSFPAYDIAINDLVVKSARSGTQIHVFNPDPTVALTVQMMLPNAIVSTHHGLPECLPELRSALMATPDPTTLI